MILNIVYLIIYVVLSIILSIQDIKTMHVNAILVYIGCFLAILHTVVFQRNLILSRLIGAVCLFLIFYAVYKIKKGLGFGDVLYSFYCGLIVGFPWCFVGCALSSFLGIIFICIRQKKEKKIPFIPFLFLGSISILVKCLEPFN